MNEAEIRILAEKARAAWQRQVPPRELADVEAKLYEALPPERVLAMLDVIEAAREYHEAHVDYERLAQYAKAKDADDGDRARLRQQAIVLVQAQVAFVDALAEWDALTEENPDA